SNPTLRPSPGLRNTPRRTAILASSTTGQATPTPDISPGPSPHRGRGSCDRARAATRSVRTRSRLQQASAGRLPGPRSDGATGDMRPTTADPSGPRCSREPRAEIGTVETFGTRGARGTGETRL